MTRYITASIVTVSFSLSILVFILWKTAASILLNCTV